MSDQGKESKRFDVLPVGLCAPCLQSMGDPKHEAARYVGLGGDQGIWVVYCQHNRCGAYTFAGNAGTQWTLHTPIEPTEFTSLLKTTVDLYLEAERRHGR